MGTFDFETYSETDLTKVGAAVYAAHPSTEVLCLAYDIGQGRQLWLPGMPPPQDLFDYTSGGGLLEAWNCMFEFRIWREVCQKRMGWPALPFWQLRDTMAHSRAHALPGGLGDAAKVLGTAEKDADGKRLLKKFSTPQRSGRRIKPADDPDDAQKLYNYCVDDVVAEQGIAERLPPLIPSELDFWLCTMACNERGVTLDTETIDAAIVVLDAALEQYNKELHDLTGGEVERASQGKRLQAWLKKRGVSAFDLQADTVEFLLAKTGLDPLGRRALEIRQLIGSAGVKKLYAMHQRVHGGRVHDLFVYHGARTGRDTGADVQPQNLVKAGPSVYFCPTLQRWRGAKHAPDPTLVKKWRPEAVEDVVAAMRTRSLAHVEEEFGDAVLAISGLIRGLFIAGPGKRLICSDYSAIEAVVTAILSGEQWRIDTFHRKEDIYLHSASAITGVPFEQYTKDHPDRQKIGKIAELSLGFGGWVNAWRNFDKTDNFTDDQVKTFIKEWRKKSPAIVELWGGQLRGLPWAPTRRELFGIEGNVISAIQQPGKTFTYRMLSFLVESDKLFIILPSGRRLTYHEPRLEPVEKWGQVTQKITFSGWNNNPQMGRRGWVRIETFGGRLAENCIQGVARDIMAHAVVNAERRGYPCVLRVHDELVAEVPEGFGSVEEFEAIMGELPAWAEGWPIRAAGGWEGHRYRKD